MKHGIEKRRHKRENHEEKLYVEIVSASDAHLSDNLILECSTRNVSSSGLSVRSEYPLMANAVLELMVTFSSSDSSTEERFLLTAEIKWSKQLAADHFIIGFELIDSEHSDYLAWQKLFESKN